MKGGIRRNRRRFFLPFLDFLSFQSIFGRQVLPGYISTCAIVRFGRLLTVF
jgi:hypothetical protein